jgi:heat shock protein HspQ
LLAENDETEYVAYVSEQNLQVDETQDPVRHPQVKEFFAGFDAKKRQYKMKAMRSH